MLRRRALSSISAAAVAVMMVDCSAGGDPTIANQPRGVAGASGAPADVDPKVNLDVCKQADDCDGDGFATSEDCDDNNPAKTPAAYDFPNDSLDNDCDGTIDNPLTACETVPESTPGSAVDFARALDLCAHKSWDPLLRAEFGTLEGAATGQRKFISQTKPEQVRILRAFGENQARLTGTMIGLSTGPFGVRQPRDSAPLDHADDPTYRLVDACASIPLKEKDCEALTGSTAPAGISVQDVAELKLWLRVPVNAGALAFDFSFFSTEFNQFWNGALNDAFIVLVSSSKYDGVNVALDEYGHGINVNSGFFQLCLRIADGLSDDKRNALTHCAGIDGDPLNLIFGSLRGTWFDGAGNEPNDGTALTSDNKRYLYGGGTGWLTGRIAVTPGENLHVRLMIHDTFDGKLDSAVLIDAMRWEAEPATGVSRPPK